MKYFLIPLLWLIAPIGYTDEIFPVGCQAVVVANETVVLSAEKSVLVMIHNISATNVWITHSGSESNSSANWSSRLQAGHWSALLLGHKEFELVCIESKPGHEQQAPCSSLLSICQWPKVKVPKGESATFWAGEDLSLPALTAHIGSHGFVLPALTQSVLD